MDLIAGDIGLETGAVAGGIVSIHHRRDRLTGQIEDDVRLGAGRLDKKGLAGERISILTIRRQMLGAQADNHRLARTDLAVRSDADRGSIRKTCGRLAVFAVHRAVENIHRRRPYERCDEEIGRFPVEFERCTLLLHPALIEHNDAVGKRDQIEAMTCVT